MKPCATTRVAANAAALAALLIAPLLAQPAAPRFELVQPELFGVTGGQPNAWADFDNDGDLDQFVGFRGRPNRLYRQDHGRFEDVAAAVGIADNVETRAAAWGDFDADGHVELYVGFIGGTPNKLYRNDGNGRHFTDVALALGVNLTGVTRRVSWIDYDNDGRPDLYVAGFLVNVTHYPDHLFHNRGRIDARLKASHSIEGKASGSIGSTGGTRFHDVLPALVNDHDASHGVQWVDFDNDGALDLALTNNDPAGGHYLFRNLLPAGRARQSLAVDVVDADGRHTKPGAEVRVYAAGTRRLISSGLVDTRQQLLLAERHAGSRRDWGRRACRYRSNGDGEEWTPRNEALGRCSEDRRPAARIAD